MDQTLDQLQEKLDNYLKQRQSVLIAQANDPQNETINKLLSDLNEAIHITEDLIKIKKQQEENKKQQEEKKQNDEQVSQKVEPQQPVIEKYNVGGYCMGLYKGEWYVAKIEEIKEPKPEENEKGPQYHVRYVGYGNTAILSTEKGNIKPFIPPKKEQLKPGTKIYAVYSVDGLFYEAIVDKVTENNSVWVTFCGYGNSEECPFEHVRLLQTTPQVVGDEKAKKKKQKKQKKEAERNSRVESWKNFLKKSGLKRKESMFKTPDTFDGRVGVIGSGKGMTKTENNYVPLAKKRKIHLTSADEIIGKERHKKRDRYDKRYH